MNNELIKGIGLHGISHTIKVGVVLFDFLTWCEKEHDIDARTLSDEHLTQLIEIYEEERLNGDSE